MNQSSLAASNLIDSDHPRIIEFASRAAGAGDELQRAVNLYYAVRDGIRYDPYCVGPDARYFRASDCLERGRGFCIPKAALMAACARSQGLAARVGYADVRNHLSTPKLDELVGGDVYTWHSHTELWLEGRWVKCTPAFNLSLCRRFGVKPLEFDGRQDSLLQEFDQSGRRHMEYLGSRGVYDEVPLAAILDDFQRLHGNWLHHAADVSDAGFAPAD